MRYDNEENYNNIQLPFLYLFFNPVFNRLIIGNTALHMAITKGNLELTNLLLDNGASLNIENKRKLTPLMTAIRQIKDKSIRFAIVKALVDKDPSIIEYSNERGESALLFAIKGNMLDLLQIFAEKGVDLRKID